MREIASSLAAVPSSAAALYPIEQLRSDRASWSNAIATKPSVYAAPRHFSATPRTGYTGRYTQADPLLQFEGISFEEPNSFGYARQNPLRYFDPNGLTAYRGFPPDKQKEMEDAVRRALD